MLSDLPVIRKGSFYSIRDDHADLVLEDKTKSGLTIMDTLVDEKLDIMVDVGMIYDMDGIGHRVIIRWFFPKVRFELDQVLKHAKALETKYARLRDITCPSDSM